MSRNVLSVLFLCGSFVALSKVHKFSPEFQATYDAATAPEVQEAQRKGADARIIYTVVDDDGYPITNAWVRGTWQNDYPRKTWKESFVTDTNGMFVAQAKVGGQFGCIVEKAGYYSSTVLFYDRLTLPDKNRRRAGRTRAPLCVRRMAEAA